MKLKVLRFSSQADSTNGLLFEESEMGLKFLAYTLEDENRVLKKKGETRIQAGIGKKEVFMKGMVKGFLTYIKECWKFVMFLCLNMYLYIVVILMNILLDAFLWAIRRKTMLSSRMALLESHLMLTKEFIRLSQDRWKEKKSS